MPDVEDAAPTSADEAAAKVRGKLAAARPPKHEELAAYLVGVSAGLVGREPHETLAHLIAAGIERALAGPALVRRGDVAFTLAAEIQQLGADLHRVTAFERRVVEAAKSPSAWLMLREELSK